MYYNLAQWGFKKESTYFSADIQIVIKSNLNLDIDIRYYGRGGSIRK